MKKRKDNSKSKKTGIDGLELKDIILGGQDGVVNVLGLVLGVAAATNTTKIVLISGLAATFAESISMAAVAYTSTKAAKQYYLSRKTKIPKEDNSPAHSTIVVGLSSFIGSLIPLLPFFFFSVSTSIILSLIISVLVLYIVGYQKAKITIGDPVKEGIQLSLIGISAATVGYLIGFLLGKI